jgi:hypothetical protein
MVGIRCGKWMPRKRTVCARRQGHAGECRTAAAVADRRVRKGKRRVGGIAPSDGPDARRRYFQKSKLVRYGLTQEQFDQRLEDQQNACAMCFKAFAAGGTICIDHDHACCPSEKRSCGKCVRGLLCRSCNTSLGHIERRYALARAYLERRPAGGQSEISNPRSS